MGADPRIPGGLGLSTAGAGAEPAAPRLRLARSEDAGGIHAIYAPQVRAGVATFEITVPSVATMAERIAEIAQRYPYLVAEDADGLLGYAYATRFRTREAYDWTAECAVYVAERARRRGVGVRLYRRLFELAQVLGYRCLMAGVTVPNPASEALHRSVGFERVGTWSRVGWKFDRWHDVGVFQRHLPGSDPPARPLTPAEASSRGLWVC